MPFDTTDFPITTPAEVDPHAVFRARREAAVALWATVPPEQFNISFFYIHDSFPSCGTAACALGWLGASEHDGWRMSKFRTFPVWNGRCAFGAAEDYFGLSSDDAGICFSSDGYWQAPHAITLADVSAMLLSLPYVTP